jgi:hypothetical protein
MFSNDQEELTRRSFRKTMFPDRWAISIFIVVVLFVPLCLGLTQMSHNPKFSVIDETAHFAYAHGILSQGLPKLGQHFDQFEMNEIACQGVYLPGWTFPPCGATTYLNSQFPGGGYITEAIQPPGYYAVVAIIGTSINWAFNIGILHALRIGSLLWLTAGLILLWASGRLVGISPIKLGAGILILAAAPTTVYFSAIVSNDASSIFAGSFIAFVCLLASLKPGKWVPYILASAGFLVVMLKPLDFIPVLVFSGLFAVSLSKDVWQNPDGWPQRIQSVVKRWLPTGGMLLGSSLLGILFWLVLQKHIELVSIQSLCGVVNGAVPYYPSQLFIDPLSLWQPLTSFQSFNQAYFPHSVATYLEAGLNVIIAFGLVAGGISLVFVKEKLWAHWMGFFSLIALYVGGLSLALNDWSICRSSFGSEGRYGLSCAPLLVLAFLGASRGKWVTLCLWLVGIASVTADLSLMLVA